MLHEQLIQPIIDCASDLIADLREHGDHIIHTDQNSSAPGLPRFGLRRSARLPILAAIYNEVKRPILLLSDRTDHAFTISDELSLLAPSADQFFFPEPGPLFYENAPWGERTRRDRLVTLTNFASYHVPGAQTPQFPPLVVAPARAVMALTIPRQEFLLSMRTIKPGQTVQLNEILRDLILRGYEPVNTVVSPGQIARRGGILDIWPPAETQPVRIDFFWR